VCEQAEKNKKVIYVKTFLLPFCIIDMLQRLQTSYGLGDIVIKWFSSYLTGRTQFTTHSEDGRQMLYTHFIL